MLCRADEITVPAPDERVDLEALKATKARRKGAEAGGRAFDLAGTTQKRGAPPFVL